MHRARPLQASRRRVGALMTALAAAVPATATAATSATIRAVVTGIRHPNGNVRMSLFASPEGFPDEPERSVQWQQVQIEGDSAVVVFNPVPEGQYAIATFHDEDGNGALRRDWLGRPKEGWGVSRDAKARFGPPKFDQSVITATPDTCTVRLHMRY